MQKILKRADKISLKLLVFILASIVFVTALFSYTSYNIIRSAYFGFFNDKTLLTNRIVAAQISGDDLKSYIDALKQDETYKERQLKFYSEKLRLLELLELEKKSGNHTEEMAQLRQGLHEFYRESSKFKDEKYFRIQQQLDELRKVAGAKYLYIFADTNLPGLYTYLFDAKTLEEANELDRDDIGTVDLVEEFTGADHVFATKQQMEHSEYYEGDLYGIVYYAFSPIFASDGNLVAIVGTDLDLEGMTAHVKTMLRYNTATSLIFSGLFTVFFYLFLQRMVLKPILTLTKTAADISDGHTQTGVPQQILNRNDEMGLLAKALDTMTKTFQNMLASTKQLFDAAIEGRLDIRNDPSTFKGDVAQVVKQINDTLDIIGIYFNSMPEVFFIINDRMELAFKNKRFVSVFGHKSTIDIVIDIVSEIVPGARSYDSKELIKKLDEIVGSETYTALAWFTLSDDLPHCFSITCCNLVLNEIKRGTLFIASDITDLMQEKDKAQAASKAKSEFLSRVSHELRSPMNVIIGMSRLGMKDAEKETDSRAHVRFQNIASASSHLLNIINDVLDMSRIEAGRMEIKHEALNIAELVAKCIDLLKIQMEEKHLAFSHSIDQGIPVVLKGDPFHLTQVLVNMLTNAIKYTERDGKISLNVYPTEPKAADAGKICVSFSISDTGIGMSADFLEKIFDPFEQEDGYLQRRYQGTGLGLSICKRLVELMGGKLDVESELKEGSTFTFVLPFEVEVEAEEAVQSGAEQDSLGTDFDFSGIRMLLADDIDINRVIVAESFADTGISITEARDGAEALRLFAGAEEGYFDIVFMDVQMPHMDGYQATKAIRALPRNDAKKIPIIAMTANALREDVEEAISVGMNAHLSKPIDIEACFRTIAEYCKTQIR